MSNPLRDIHRQAQADFLHYGELEIVNTFGEPQAEYAAVRKSAALMDMPQRGMIGLTGRDRLVFLNNLLTAELWNKQTRSGIEPGRWLYSFLLNLKGRIVADLKVLELQDFTLLDVEASLAGPLLRLLEAYRITEQVNLENRSGELHELALFGPKAPEILELPALGPGQCAQVRRFGVDMIVYRDDMTGSPGLLMIVPATAARLVWMKLIASDASAAQRSAAKVRAIGWAAFNTTRIEAGLPLFGIDIEPAPVASAMPLKQQRESATGSESAPHTPGMLPAETAQLERAVCLTKCYLGQEIVARMHSRGQVARRIVAIRMESDALPLSGAQIFDDALQQAGIVTSSTNSPLLSNLAICLGVVKKPLFEVGSALRIAAEGALRKATVVQTPFI